jgi:hypothetical protein
MKKFAAFLLLAFLATLSVRAEVLFSDSFNYANGSIETDGVWQVYSPAPPAAPYGDAYVENDMLILNSTNYDSVDAPFTTNRGGSTVVFASFTIDVTTLPSAGSGFFCEFQDVSNVDEVAYVFITTNDTLVPGTYRLGINNYIETSSLTTGKVALYPLDMAPNLHYNVVISYDTDQNAAYPAATLVVNPASMADYDASPAYGTDNSPTPGQASIDISAIGFSQYEDQGVIDIGDLIVGTSFGDVSTNTPVAPVIGVQPQDGGAFSGNNITLYTAADGLGQLSYQWYSNTVALSDDGASVFGSLSNILTLSNLQISAGYSVVVANSAGSVTSRVAEVSVTNTPTPPFFLTEPDGATNGLGGAITLTALANGTGPLTYAWYFEETNTGAFVPVGTGSTLTLANLVFTESGSYYVTATGGQGSLNSAAVTVQVVPPPLVTIGYLHSFISDTDTRVIYNNIYSVTGVVTTIGNILSTGSASEYFVQDATGGALVYIGGGNATNDPPAGAFVQLTGPIQSYYGELEIDPTSGVSSNSVHVISTGNPVPAPQPLNLDEMVTNTLDAYGIAIECSLVSLTNVYIYNSATGGSVAGLTFPTNSYKYLYACLQPYAQNTNQPMLEMRVYTYTNVNNQINTNYWGKPIPAFCYELTGDNGVYSPTEPLFYPTRYQDFVTTLPAPFMVGISPSTNGTLTINWPAVAGSTYTLHSAPTLTGPWTQTFGLSYYPSTGSYTITNSGAAEFFELSSP